jgi:hypothetical protein
MMISQSSSPLQIFLQTRSCPQSAQIVAVLWQIFSAIEHVTITICNGPLFVSVTAETSSSSSRRRMSQEFPYLFSLSEI